MALPSVTSWGKHCSRQPVNVEMNSPKIYLKMHTFTSDLLDGTFVRGADAIREQFSRVWQSACCEASWSVNGPPCLVGWPGYPLLYRILSGTRGRHGIDEGDGLHGIESRSLYLYYERPRPHRCQVVEHVKENPRVTPWISTSFSQATQENIIRKKFQLRQWAPEGEVFMATIDVRYLEPSSSIVDLSYGPTLDELMLDDEKARRFASVWDEVLVFWEVPERAVVSSKCYRYNHVMDTIDGFEVRNPNFAYNMRPICPRMEDFSLDRRR